MGILQALRLRRPAVPVATASTDPILWGTSAGGLDPEIAAAFGYYVGETTAITRRQAMKIPAVKRGRNVICGTIAQLPLIERGPGVDAEGNPGAGLGDRVDRQLWTQPDPTTTLAYSLAWIVDDLVFYPCAWLRVTGRDVDDWPATWERLSRDRVRVVGRQVFVDGVKQEDRDLIRIDGLDEGLLCDAGESLATLRLLNSAARRFAKLDVPLGILKLIEGAPELTQTQIDTLLDAWETARATRTTAFMNASVGYDTVDLDADRIQMTDGRQYGVAEVARLMNLPPRALNAATASPLTYSTSVSERRELLDMSLSLYMAPIAQRLSMSDVCRPGHAVSWDVSNWLTGDAADVIKSGAEAITAGIYDADEVRQQLGKGPRQ